MQSEEEVRAQKKQLARTKEAPQQPHRPPEPEDGSSHQTPEEEPKRLDTVETVGADSAAEPTAEAGPSHTGAGLSVPAGDVRQRLPTSAPEGTGPGTDRTLRSGTGESRGRTRRRRREGGGGWGTLVLMWILITVIAALLARRLYHI